MDIHLKRGIPHGYASQAMSSAKSVADPWGAMISKGDTMISKGDAMYGRTRDI
jgi:hypothetical protein